MLRSRSSDGVVAVPAFRVRAVSSWTDVLFAAAVSLLVAVHLTIFFAVLVLAPVSAAEQRSLDLLHLPVEVARALTLPFEALLLVSLFVLGRRAAGRWAGFGAMLAVLALNLRAEPQAVVYGPSVATGGWAAAALLAAAIAVVARHRVAAGALLGVAAVAHGLTALALPAFLAAFALCPTAPTGRERLRDALRFLLAWAIPFGIGQLVWLVDLGPAAYAARAAVFTRILSPHPLVPFLEQQAIVFGAWHFPVWLTVALAAFLFLASGTGVVRYFAVPRPEERGPKLLAVLRRFPLELWAAAFSFVAFSTWWGLSGDRALIEPTMPLIVAVVPLITAMAYRGAKWLITVSPFWALCGITYLTGLILARSTQLILTLVQAFQR